MFAWLGKITLETYLSQLHIYLQSNAKNIIVFIPGYRFLNFSFATVIYLSVAYILFNLTTEFSAYLFPNNSRTVGKNILITCAVCGAATVCALILKTTGYGAGYMAQFWKSWCDSSKKSHHRCLFPAADRMGYFSFLYLHWVMKEIDDKSPFFLFRTRSERRLWNVNTPGLAGTCSRCSSDGLRSPFRGICVSVLFFSFIWYVGMFYFSCGHFGINIEQRKVQWRMFYFFFSHRQHRDARTKAPFIHRKSGRDSCEPPLILDLKGCLKIAHCCPLFIWNILPAIFIHLHLFPSAESCLSKQRKDW